MLFNKYLLNFFILMIFTKEKGNWTTEKIKCKNTGFVMYGVKVSQSGYLKVKDSKTSFVTKPEEASLFTYFPVGTDAGQLIFGADKCLSWNPENIEKKGDGEFEVIKCQLNTLPSKKMLFRIDNK